MKKLSALLAIVLPVVAQGQSRFELSIPNIMRGPEVYGREPQNPHFTPNGEWLYFNWLPPGTDWREPNPRRAVELFDRLLELEPAASNA